MIGRAGPTIGRAGHSGDQTLDLLDGSGFDQMSSECRQSVGLEQGHELADGWHPIDCEAQRICAKCGQHDGSIPVGGHLAADGNRPASPVRGGDRVTDHPDQSGVEDIVPQGADRIVPVNSQRRCDQVVGAEGEEVDPLRPGVDQWEQRLPPRS